MSQRFWYRFAGSIGTRPLPDLVAHTIVSKKCILALLLCGGAGDGL